MTFVLSNSVANPRGPLKEPAEVIILALTESVRELVDHAERRDLDIDWSSLDIRTEVDVHETRTFAQQGAAVEIRMHTFRVRALEKAAES